MAKFSKIRFGDGLSVTDEGDGVITVAGGGGGGGGIQFDTYPQAGNWLYVEGSNNVGAPYGWAIDFYDHGVSGDGIRLQSDEGRLGFYGWDIQMATTDKIRLDADTYVNINAGTYIIVSANNGQLNLYGDSGVNINAGTIGTNDSVDIAADLVVLGQGGGTSSRITIDSDATPALTLASAGPVSFTGSRVAMANLPTTPGATGELYVDASGFVKRA